MAEFPSPQTYRPAIIGNHFMVSTGHYLASMAAVRILENGGNATDAGVAAGMCINVLHPDMTNLGGVAPIILYDSATDDVRTISGLGTWPANVQLEFLTNEWNGDLPTGVNQCVMPAAIDSWLTALRLYGSMSLAEVSAPAIALAEEGFAAYDFLCANIAQSFDTIRNWEASAAVYLPNGASPRPGDRIVQRDVAGLLRMLIEAEQGAQHGGRETGIQVARDRFYKGDIAERIAEFFHMSGGFLTLDDLKTFAVDVEEPVSVNYRGFDVYSCGPWCQGPVVLQALAILEGYDLASLGQNSAEALHLIIEALKAAFADREHYYGDPKFVDVPMDGLLNPDYAATWRDRISLDHASSGMPIPGNPRLYQQDVLSDSPRAYEEPQAFQARVSPDTSYLCVVDKQGNAFSATPSDGITTTPVIPGLGIIVSGRGEQSWLDSNHPSSIEPGKRPRLTPSPGLIMKDHRVFAPYGTPGSDVQPQAMVQLAINLIDFEMNPQAAVEAPRVASFSFPRSSHPHPYSPGLLNVERRIPRHVSEALQRMGHRVEEWPAWSPQAGSMCTIVVDPVRKTLSGGADPRRLAYAIGW